MRISGYPGKSLRTLMKLGGPLDAIYQLRKRKENWKS